MMLTSTTRRPDSGPEEPGWSDDNAELRRHMDPYPLPVGARAALARQVERDLRARVGAHHAAHPVPQVDDGGNLAIENVRRFAVRREANLMGPDDQQRKSVVTGKRVSGRVDIGG